MSQIVELQIDRSQLRARDRRKFREWLHPLRRSARSVARSGTVHVMERRRALGSQFSATIQPSRSKSARRPRCEPSRTLFEEAPLRARQLVVVEDLQIEAGTDAAVVSGP